MFFSSSRKTRAVRRRSARVQRKASKKAHKSIFGMSGKRFKKQTARGKKAARRMGHRV